MAVNVMVFFVPFPKHHSILFHTFLYPAHEAGWAGIAQSLKRLAKGWVVWGSNPGEGEVFRTHLDRPWGPPSLLCRRYRVSLPGVKWLGVAITTHSTQRRG